MRDRQLFHKTVLPNGITVFTYKIDAPIACLEIQLPTGAAHSHSKNGFFPGSVHFLEHMQIIRSENFPKAHQLDRELGMRGCHFNATTYRSKTTYWIDSPVHELDFATTALIDRVYHPVFTAEDIATERTVVINERERERFYPGRNRVSQYYNTEFMSDVPYPIEQIFGSTTDLQAITPEVLTAMHQIITASSHTAAIAVGNSDFTEFMDALATVDTKDHLLDKKMADTHWVNPAFRIVPFDTVTRPTLEMAWIHPRTSYREKIGIDFILALLTNYVHGTLHQEFRHEKGWTYGLNYFFNNHRQTLFGLSFPVNTIEQLQYIRQHIGDRIEKTIKNQKLVEREIKRRINNQVFNYQTTGAIMAGASRDLIGNKKIHTEKEWQKEILAMEDIEWRKELVERFFRHAAMGEIGFVPENS
jgi:predicted Zn-dependent peptidase